VPSLVQGGASGQKPLILLVDDFEDGRDLYCDYLTFKGFRVPRKERADPDSDAPFSERITRE
jgi:hypothetical protein